MRAALPSAWRMAPSAARREGASPSGTAATARKTALSELVAIVPRPGEMRRVEIQPGLCEALGYRVEAILQASRAELVPGDDRLRRRAATIGAEAAAELGAVLADGEPAREALRERGRRVAHVAPAGPRHRARRTAGARGVCGRQMQHA